jgi:hypothetical protein
MNWKITIALVIVLAGCLIGAALLVKSRSAGPGLTVTLRIAVTPGNQSGYVLATAQSAKFKYLAGKTAGVKPTFAQRLSLKAVPNTSLIEARLHLPTTDQATRYAEAFLATLQGECGHQVQLAIAEQSIR